jgi:hypothetical protein
MSEDQEGKARARARALIAALNEWFFDFGGNPEGVEPFKRSGEVNAKIAQIEHDIAEIGVTYGRDGNRFVLIDDGGDTGNPPEAEPAP